MFRFLLPLTFLATSAVADDPKYMYTVQGCNTLEVLIQGLIPYGETPLFTGEIVQFGIGSEPYTGRMIFAVNQQTGTYSMISVWPDGTACLVATGVDFEPFGG